MITFIEIDGSHEEGGGQILRNSLALSAALCKPIKVVNIRKNRTPSGLKPQHLTCVKAAAKLCNAEFTGAELGSTEITFIPKKLKGGTFEIDIGTAGSITLLLQSILLPCACSGKRTIVRITGGTDVEWSMPADYLQLIAIPAFNNYAQISMKILKRGYYPKGKGLLEVKTRPKTPTPIKWVEQGKLAYITGVSHASKDLENRQVAERQTKSVTLEKLTRIRNEYNDSLSTGSGIVLVANYVNPKGDVETRIGADCLGKKGVPAEEIGRKAVQSLIKEMRSGASVDSHLADNLVTWVAVFGGQYLASEITPHTKASIYVAKQFGAEIELKNNLIISNNSLFCVPKKGARVIIIDNGKILLVHRIKNKKEYFVLPGGALEEDETPLSAAIRELKEETNLDADLELAFEFQEKYNNNYGYYFLAKKFKGVPEFLGPELNKSSKNNQYSLEWKSLSNLAKINLYPVELKKKIPKLLKD